MVSRYRKAYCLMIKLPTSYRKSYWPNSTTEKPTTQGVFGGPLKKSLQPKEQVASTYRKAFFLKGNRSTGLYKEVLFLKLKWLQISTFHKKFSGQPVTNQHFSSKVSGQPVTNQHFSSKVSGQSVWISNFHKK